MDKVGYVSVKENKPRKRKWTHVFTTAFNDLSEIEKYILESKKGSLEVYGHDYIYKLEIFDDVTREITTKYY